MLTIGRIMLRIFNIRFFYWYDVSAHSLCNMRHHENLDTNLAVERNDVKCIRMYNFPDHLLWIPWKKLFPQRLFARKYLFPDRPFFISQNFLYPYVFLLETFYSLIIFFYIMEIFIPLMSFCYYTILLYSGTMTEKLYDSSMGG